MIKSIFKAVVILAVLVLGMWGPVKIAQAQCQVTCCDPLSEVCADWCDTGAEGCGANDPQDQGDCGPGEYQAPDGGCEEYGGGPACFLAGTKIAMAGPSLRQGFGGQSKNIEDVKIGDVVYTFANDLISKSTVINTLKSNRDFYYSLEAGSYKVDVAAEHRFYVGNGNFTEVQYLKTGDTVYVMEGMKLAKKTVTKNVRVDKASDVYNLTIDKTQTYFANDFAVHNLKCGACGEIGYDSDAMCCPSLNGVCVPFCGLACVPSTGSPPTPAPAYTYPENGALVASTTVNISWDPVADWGSCNCPMAYSYSIAVKEANADGTEPNWGNWTKKLAGTETSYAFTGIKGKTYYWKVVAQNGCWPSVISPPWKFTILDQKAIGTVYYDPNNTCLTDDSTPMAGQGMSVYVPRTCPVIGDKLVENNPPGSTYTLFTIDVTGLWHFTMRWPPAKKDTVPLLAKYFRDNAGAEYYVHKEFLWPYLSCSHLTNVVYADPENIIMNKSHRIFSEGAEQNNNVCGNYVYNMAADGAPLATGEDPACWDGMHLVNSDSPVGADGKYEVENLGNGTGYAFELKNIPAGYQLSDCSANPRMGVDSPSDTNFFLTDAGNADAWWQAEGGNVHADNGGVSSQIPAGCSGSCKPYLIAADSGGATGLASYASGAVETGGGGISEDGNNWQANTVYKGTKTDYAYFKRVLENDGEGVQAWDGSLPGASGIYLSEGSQTIAGGDWEVGADQKIVLLVDGEVTIANNINVVEGGFLAIITSGNIIINPSVTNVEGVFISGGVISTGLGTDQLVGEGIFTGWGGFSLLRDLVDPIDTSMPAEKFIYRQDLQLNAYRYLMRPDLFWQEVNP